MDIMEIAKQLSECEELVQRLGMANQPVGYKERVAADARYRLAVSARDMTRRAYENALARMSDADLLALASVNPNDS